MTTCNICGDCCRVIALGYTKRDLDRREFDITNWIKNHFRRISRATAEHKMPGYKGKKGLYFYTCNVFNEESNTCTAYEERPMLCKNFPWYGREPFIGQISGYPNCSYLNDCKEVI